MIAALLPFLGTAWGFVRRWSDVIVAMVAVATVAALTWKIKANIDAAAIARAEGALATYRADVLRETVAGQVKVAELQTAAAEATAKAIERGLAEISGSVVVARDAAVIAGAKAAILELHHDPAFDCRRVPLPDRFIDGLFLPPG